MTVPITLMDIRSDSGLEVYPADTEHLFSVSISSYPEQVYYPMNSYSYNEMNSFMGTIKRSSGSPSDSADSSVSVLWVNVSLNLIVVNLLLC